MREPASGDGPGRVRITHVEDVMTEMVPAARDMARALVLDYPPVDVCVRALAWRCWRCGRSSPAFGVVHVEGFTDPSSVVRTVEGLELEYARELLELAGSPLAGTIRPRYSRSLGGSYTSSGCLYCNALFGAFFIHEELTAVQAADTVETMPLITRLPRPQLEIFLLDALSNAAT